MRVCVITDNKFIFERFRKLVKNSQHEFEFYYSSFNKKFSDDYRDELKFKPVRLKECDAGFFDRYDVFFSLHSKQMFPVDMVRNYRCINFHPGLNPYNRGWFPQTFSLVNHLPVGVTIHEMDAELDHGPIIYQKEVEVESWETSWDVYNKILSLEIELLDAHLDDLVKKNYVASPMQEEGNINKKEDFDRICKLDLESMGTFREHIDLLRALTFSGYDNAYFVDKKGNKVYVTIDLAPAGNRGEKED